MPLDPKRPVPFNGLLSRQSLVAIDTETTGLGEDDRVVEIAFVRFENGIAVAKASSVINPCRLIPAEASAIHGVTDEHVQDAPTIDRYMRTNEVRDILRGAQPLAYNAEFDRRMFPFAAVEDLLSSEHPWIDCMLALWHHDRYTKGAGRHRLSAACERHGIKHERAHGALSDAQAAGELFFKLAPTIFAEYKPVTVGKALEWMLRTRAAKWADYESYRAKRDAAAQDAPAPEVSP